MTTQVSMTAATRTGCRPRARASAGIHQRDQVQTSSTQPKMVSGPPAPPSGENVSGDGMTKSRNV